MIDWSVKEGICEVAMANPPCNEIGTALLEQWEKFLKEFDPASARVLILYSRLESGFSAGAHLRELYQGMLDRPREEHASGLRPFLDRVHAVLNALDTLPLVTVGVVHRVCFGGGFELALACDLLVADSTARFCFPELRLGLIPGFGGIPRLERELGNAAIRDLLFTGRSLSARKAGELGLVSQVVASGEALKVAREMAQQIAKFDSTVTAAAKSFIKPLPLARLAEEKERFLTLFQRPTVQEALRKFVESETIWSYVA